MLTSKGQGKGRRHRGEVKKQESKNEDKPVQKRRLSSNSEVEEAEPKSKIPKLKVESDCEPEVKKLKSEPMTPMGRIPKECGVLGFWSFSDCRRFAFVL